MSESLIVILGDDAPDLAGRRRYAVEVTARRQDDGQPLVPRQLPDQVLACWSATEVVASVEVLAVKSAGGGVTR